MQKQAVINNHKKELIHNMLNEGMLTIFVDASREGVVLPPDWMGIHKVPLNLSYGFKTIIELMDDAIHAVLSFNQQSFNCVIPWSAIWMARQNEAGFVDPAALPEKESVFAPPLERVEEKPTFQVVNGDGESTPPRRGHLRTIH